MRRTIALVVLSLCAACGSSPDTAEEATGTQSSADTGPISGNWTMTAQCTDSPDPSAPAYVITACNGTILWTGTFVGSSPFVAHAWPHLPGTAASFTVNTLTFTGTGFGTSGTFSMNGSQMIWDPTTNELHIYGLVTATTGGFVSKLKINTKIDMPGTGSETSASGTYVKTK